MDKTNKNLEDRNGNNIGSDLITVSVSLKTWGHKPPSPFDASIAAAITYGWEPLELTLPALAAKLATGHAVTAIFLDNHRKRENFTESSLIYLDVDNQGSSYTPLSTILSHPFIKDYGGIVHETLSSSLNKGKYRIIFRLPEPVTDPEYYERITAGLIRYFSAFSIDSSCKDAARFFFGAKQGGEIIAIGNVLTPNALGDLLNIPDSRNPSPSTEAARRESRTFGSHRQSYYEVALQKEVEAVMQSRNGTRNNTLNRAAFAMARFVDDGQLPESEVRERLRNAALHVGLPEKEIESTLRSGLNGRKQNPPASVLSFTAKSVESVTDVSTVSGVITVTDDPLFETIDAATLSKQQFTEPEWVIEGILPIGLAIIGGRPKIGKSWFVLNLALAIANGINALGCYPCNRSEVLYLALEDNERRLQRRLHTLSQADGVTLPDTLHFKTKFKTFDNGGFDDLQIFLKARPNIRLVIIDTLQKLRGKPRGGKDSYGGDYAEIGELQKIALQCSVAILLVHHTTKQQYQDPFDSISGTTGITGAADTLYVLARDTGGRGITFHARGRDIEGTEVAVAFDKTTGVWNSLGDAGMFRLSEQRQSILNVLSEAQGGMTAKEIAEATGLSYSSVRNMLSDMSRKGNIENRNKKYTIPSDSGDSDYGSDKRDTLN